MKTEQTKTIYDLELHEKIYIDNEDAWVTRVPGGWLYKYFSYKNDGYGIEENIKQIVFVRYHNEFQIKTGSNF